MTKSVVIKFNQPQAELPLIKARFLSELPEPPLSIKLGKITSSTILRRLGTYSRRSKLYFAFRELGKVVRTPLSAALYR